MRIRDAFLLSDDPEVARKQIRNTKIFIYWKLFGFPLVMWGVGKLMQKAIERQLEEQNAHLNPDTKPNLMRLSED